MDVITKPRIKKLPYPLFGYEVRANVIRGQPDCLIDVALLGLGRTLEEAWEELSANAARLGHKLEGMK